MPFNYIEAQTNWLSVTSSVAQGNAMERVNPNYRMLKKNIFPLEHNLFSAFKADLYKLIKKVLLPWFLYVKSAKNILSSSRNQHFSDLFANIGIQKQGRWQKIRTDDLAETDELLHDKIKKDVMSLQM